MNQSEPFQGKNEDESRNQWKDEWLPCPAGLIAETAERQTILNRRRFIKTAGGIGAMAVLAALGIRKLAEWNTLKPALMEQYVSCDKVQANLDDYILNVMDDQKLRIKIEYHLIELQCPSCCRRFDQRKLTLSV